LYTAIPYLDNKIQDSYNRLLKSKTKLDDYHPGAMEIQYLYMRSFFPEFGVPKSSQSAYQFYSKRAEKTWMKNSIQLQAMMALVLHRTGNSTTAKDILRSMKENSIMHEELGRYWKDNRFGYHWSWMYAPIETQALAIEAFQEAAKDIKTADEMRTWLIKNKQTNHWRTTKATADACYAFLLQGTNWLDAEPVVQVTLGAKVMTNENQKAEAGTGYFKRTVDAKNISAADGNISVMVQQPIDPSTKQPLNAPSWGAVYWQYFEDMDKITWAGTPLQLQKKLFIQKNTDRGPVLQALNAANELHVGDKVVVRIELRVDRDMEYVHMKDLRASSLEPVNVISSFKWQGGLGYYESTRDASTNFFFNYLPKGTYVFEYSLFATHTGTFSNGITTIQSMYAPEFTSHSEGVKISVE
jgi:uncharacterized protein YfaS (alpha-2-macroglobulin family)